MTSNVECRALLHRAQALLFDFDGPICSVFSGEPAPAIARDLREALGALGVDIQLSASAAADPLEVLRTAAAQENDKVTMMADDLLTAAEVSAARTARPTPGGNASMAAARATGRRVAIVSNNSAAAVAEYLAQHGEAHLTDVIVGREYGKPAMMKPHPGPIHEALQRLGIEAGKAVFVGDSETDVEAARAAGIACIGYATKPGKVDLLTSAGADVVINDMAILAEHLAAGGTDDD